MRRGHRGRKRNRGGRHHGDGARVCAASDGDAGTANSDAYCGSYTASTTDFHSLQHRLGLFDTHSNGYGDTYRDRYEHLDTYRDRYGDQYADQHGDGHQDSDRHRDPVAYRHGHRDAHTTANNDPNGDGNTASHNYANPDEHSDTLHTCAGRKSLSVRLCGAGLQGVEPHGREFHRRRPTTRQV